MMKTTERVLHIASATKRYKKIVRKAFKAVAALTAHFVTADEVGNHSPSTRFASRPFLAGKMADLDHLWFSVGMVMVIGLIATITALTVQRFVGISAASVLVGPFIAATLVIIYTKRQPTK